MPPGRIAATAVKCRLTRTWRMIVLLVVLSLSRAVLSCDICGCYTPDPELRPALSEADSYSVHPTSGVVSAARGWYLAVSEQFTHFGSLQLNGEEVPNPTGQHLDSSITQLVAGYAINSRLALQLSAPLIYRSFERPRGFAIEHGHESGLGDVSLLADLTLLRLEKGGERSVRFDDPKSPRIESTAPTLTLLISGYCGVKLPTGSTDRLKEEFREHEIPGAPMSGIHGHDLTLGTGSWDGIFGGQASIRYHKAFFQAELQFTLRGDGEHQYHFANDLVWSAGPGCYLMRTSHAVFAAQALVSGEYKDVDRFRGKVAEDTGITSVFVGPRLLAGFRSFTAEIEAAFPVFIDNTAFQAVPDYRIRGGISFHF